MALLNIKEILSENERLADKMMTTYSTEETDNELLVISIVYKINFFDLVQDIRALLLIFKRLSIHRFEKRAIPRRN